MLVAKQVGKQASVYFIFGIFAHICFFVFIIYAMMLLGKIFLFTCLGICIITLACFHMSCIIMFTYLREKNLNFRPHRWTWECWMLWKLIKNNEKLGEMLGKDEKLRMITRKFWGIRKRGNNAILNESSSCERYD